MWKEDDSDELGLNISIPYVSKSSEEDPNKILEELNLTSNLSSMGLVEGEVDYQNSIEDQRLFNEIDYKNINEISDWYLVENDISSSFVFPGRIMVTSKLALKRYAELLWKEVVKAVAEKEKTTNEDFREIFLRISLPNISDLMIYRGNKIKSIQGDIWALRRVKGTVPDLKDLRLGSHLYSVLTSPKIKSGLILIVGETGNGKSTTCASMVKERCANHGAFALTVEDPPELPLNGPIGLGYCIQTEVRKGDFGEAIRSAMRSYPAVNNSILYVGEIRDSETARELVRVSANGHLVFATIHGEDIITGLKRLVDSAVGDDTGGKASEARNMLASSLRLVVHQQLKDIPATLNNGAPAKAVQASFVLSGGTQGGVGNLILINKLEQIPGVIEKQQRILLNKGVSELMAEVFP